MGTNNSTFADRLDFLMHVTEMHASALAKASNIDASYVSRLKSGKRSLPQDPSFLSPMCVFIAHHIRNGYQRQTMEELIGVARWPEDEAHASHLLETWLVDGPDASPVFVESPPASPKMRNTYYGPGGKREAVLQFFRLVSQEKDPQTLLLYSDEEMDWLYEEPSYAAQWACAFRHILEQGNRVKIIHNVNRDLHDLIEAIGKWVPLYMSGKIEPYYCPKLRDGIYKRTLFLAPRTAAVSSFSILRDTKGMLNELVTDKTALAALEQESGNYFRLCRPMMAIRTIDSYIGLVSLMEEFSALPGDMITLSDFASLPSMPEEVAATLQSRFPHSHIMDCWRKASSWFFRFIQGNRYTELVAGSGFSAVPFAGLMGAASLVPSEDEAQTHYRYLGILEELHPNYRFVLCKESLRGMMLYAKEEAVMLLSDRGSSCIVFIIRESKLIGAFHEYLDHLA